MPRSEPFSYYYLYFNAILERLYALRMRFLLKPTFTQPVSIYTHSPAEYTLAALFLADARLSPRRIRRFTAFRRPRFAGAMAPTLLPPPARSALRRVLEDATSSSHHTIYAAMQPARAMGREDITRDDRAQAHYYFAPLRILFFPIGARAKPTIEGRHYFTRRGAGLPRACTPG